MVPTAELRPLEQRTDRPTYEVWSEPWGSGSFSGPGARNWDDFSVSEAGATYSWRGGPDILQDLAVAVVQGRVTLAKVLADKRISWWLHRQIESYPVNFPDEDEEDLSDKDMCRRLLDAIRDGSMDIGAYDGKHSYYFFEWTNFLADAARALELPEWARCEPYEGGGCGSSYQGWHISLEPGRTLLELRGWLYDPSRVARRRKARTTTPPRAR